jgi:hypothetical protein
VPVENPLDPEEGAAGLDLPLVLFNGHASPADNPELYKVKGGMLTALCTWEQARALHIMQQQFPIVMMRG